MKRIFSIIAALSTLLVLLTGMSVYWFCTADIKHSQRTATASIARGLATSLSAQVDTIQQSADGLAQNPDVIAALATTNPAIINAVSDKLQGLVPYALRVRLLLPSIQDPEQTQKPYMGYGDLEMVHATVKEKQKPVIQGEGEHRHLAFTSLVKLNDQAIGVILVSIKPDLAQQVLAKIQIDRGSIEVKQGEVSLAQIGNPLTSDDDPESLLLSSSRWQLNFWTDTSFTLLDLTLLFTIVIIPGLLSSLLFFVGFRKLTDALHHDQSSILKAAKDMLQGKSVSNYAIQLQEMQPLMNNLAQYKRVLAQPVETTEPAAIDDYSFEEVMEIDFLDDVPHDFAAEHLTDTSINLSEVSATLVSNTKTPEASLSGEFEDEIQINALSDTVDMNETPTIPDSWDMDFESIAKQPLITPTAQPSVQSLPETRVLHPKTPAATGVAKPSQPSNIYRSYDIRGIVGVDLNEQLVTQIGRAFASEARQQGIQSIVVARDGRLSSPSLCAALIRGITASGCDVLDIGLVPTPVLYFVAHHSEGRTGVMLTGSHNPTDYNGLKLVLNGESLSGEKIQALKQRVEQANFSDDHIGSVEQNQLFSDEYIGMIAEDMYLVRPMTVVVDAGNVAASQLGPLLLKTMGCDVIELFCEVDGNFPNHHPDPSKPENMAALSKAVKLNNADVGIAFDGDGDRLGVVDSKGHIIWPDRQLMLFARDVLASKPGAEVLFDVKCSKHLPAQIAKRGGRGVMCQSGHSLMKAALKETNAALAGEMSGHIFFNDRWFGFDDGLYAAARIVEILSADMRSSSEVFADLPDSINTPELTIDLQEGENLEFVEQFAQQALFNDAELITIDGLRYEFNDGWGLIRASNTTPCLTLRFEADTPEAMSRIQTRFKTLILQIKPDISVPF